MSSATFDEALVERLADIIARCTRGEYSNYGLAKDVLSSLFATHAIVPLGEYESQARDARVGRAFLDWFDTPEVQEGIRADHFFTLDILAQEITQAKVGVVTPAKEASPHA